MNRNDQFNIMLAVDTNVRQICSTIQGISFGDIETPSTWIAHYDPENLPTEDIQNQVTAFLIAQSSIPPTVMPDITDRQFGQGLWASGIITYQEYIDFIGIGKLPTAILAVVNSPAFPDDDTGNPTPRKILSGELIGARTYSYANPLIEAFRAEQVTIDPKWTSDYLKEQWLEWSNL